MANLKFADTHNMVAFLSKPEESDRFEQIVDFLNAHPIKYALTINPTIYTLFIEQFWSTVKAKTINGEVQLHDLVDGKKIIITELTFRRDLQLEDAKDEAVHKELGDRLVRGGGLRCQETIENVSIQSYDPLLTRGNTLQSSEDSLKLNELMELCTTLQSTVLDLEKTKTTQANEIASLKKRVKKLKIKEVQELGRRINDIDEDEDITLVNVQDNDDKEMFNIDTLIGDEVKRNVIEEPSVPVSVVNALTKVSTATTTATIPTPRKGIVITESTKTTTTISSQPSQDKGKGIMVEEPVKPMKKKVQIMLDEEIALKLQAEIDEEERIAKAKEEKIDEANIAWDDIQAKVDADY
ncbi:hypothetical protein Tco_1373060 [Tanacetum coccineum]